MKKLVEACRMRGVIVDIPPEDVAREYWTGGCNIWDYQESTRRIGGWEEFSEATWPAGTMPIFNLPVETPTVAYWLYVADDGAGNVSIWVTNGSQHYDITPIPAPTEVRAGFWTGTVLNGVPVLNNGVNHPWWWDGNTANRCQTLPGWPAGQVCRSIRSYKYHLFALGLTRSGSAFPDLVQWSDAAEPGLIPQEWTAAADNDAGEVSLGDTPGGIVDAGKIRDSLAIYKNYSTIICTYVGGQFVFQFRDSPSITAGMQSLNCHAESSGFAYCFTGDDIVRHDGQSSASICTNQIRQVLIRTLDPKAWQMAQVTARHATDEIWVCIPESGQTYNSMAWIYNTQSQRWGKRELPGVPWIGFGIIPPENQLLTWDEQTTVWDETPGRWDQANYSESAAELLMCDYTGSRMLVADRVYDFAGAPVNAHVSRESYPLGRDGYVSFVTEVWPHIEGDVGQEFTVRVGAQMEYYDPISWGPPITYAIGQTPNKVDCTAKGRKFSFQFESTGGAPWRHYGFDVYYNRAGRF